MAHSNNRNRDPGGGDNNDKSEFEKGCASLKRAFNLPPTNRKPKQQKTTAAPPLLRKDTGGSGAMEGTLEKSERRKGTVQSSFGLTAVKKELADFEADLKIQF
ncbi:hypothetical protein LZ554_002955 [Drepanopeziza brunnea f. sp. 'monogermtubi']|nr:hypothetical protein LZ554_002955 [Drepanopeziza brunnea f. sp. 'monogermtubi']